MLNLDKAAEIDEEVQAKLDAIPVLDRAGKWNSRAEAVKIFKESILTHGLKEQDNRCVWCTLPVGAKGRRTPHRDHIAPKKKYSRWTFHAKNLAIACEYCNGFSVKKDLDPVDVDNDDYDAITFLLVHPYLEDATLHLSFVENEGEDEPGVVIKGHSDKGLWTIEKLDLDTPGMTIERAKELLYHRARKDLPAHFQQLLEQATERS
jgi:hypothetical protein